MNWVERVLRRPRQGTAFDEAHDSRRTDVPDGRRPNLATRYYGGNGTIHRTGHLDVETRNGRVVAVWFRCQMLPFEQHELDSDERAKDMEAAYAAGSDVRIDGLNVVDMPWGDA